MADISEYENATLEQLANLEPDWFLRMLVSLANDQNIKLGVTLIVGGTLISGQLVGGREYFTLLGQQFGRAFNMPEDKGRDMWRGIIDSHYPERDVAAGDQQSDSDAQSAKEEKQSPPTFIHLVNVRTYQGALQIPERYEGVLWRGRLSQVQGFILGEMSRGSAR